MDKLIWANLARPQTSPKIVFLNMFTTHPLAGVRDLQHLRHTHVKLVDSRYCYRVAQVYVTTERHTLKKKNKKIDKFPLAPQ